MQPFISICIPAYQRSGYLKRLLNSIQAQSYKDFEVIITDDSPDDCVKNILDDYTPSLNILYHKNPQPLGTPANWNAAIRLAKGKWIKLMHDDDWFTNENALKIFAETALRHNGAFIFSAFINKYEATGREQVCLANKFRLKALKQHPASIISQNIIGHPSTTLHPNDGTCFYDENLKWLVDIELYIRRLQQNPYVYIAQPLVTLGISQNQVTAQVKNDPKIEIPEHLYFLKKTGVNKLKHIFVYDYFWRFIRNFNIKSIDYFKKYGKEIGVPEILVSMIQVQKYIPKNILRIGFISKLLMLLHYVTHQRKLKNGNSI